jgi:hypothetical protein
MHILGCLFVFLLFAVIFIYSLVRGFFRMFFGWGPKDSSASGQRSYTTSNQKEDSNRTSSTSGTTSKKKVIDKDEGEYIDFEEVEK